MTNSTDNVTPLKLAAIGGGAMGSALLRGILRAQLHTPQAVGVSEPDRARGYALADELDIHFLPDIRQRFKRRPAIECFLMAPTARRQRIISRMLRGPWSMVSYVIKDGGVACGTP